MASHPSRCRSAGYTLVEMIAVVAIVGIIGMTGLLTSGGGGEYKLNLAETQIRDALMYARALARTTRMGHGVVFDIQNESFSVIDESGSPVVDPLTKADYVVDLKAPNQPAGLDIISAVFESAGNAALFDPQGFPLTGGTLVIKCSGSTRVLQLDEATGKLGAP